MAHFSSAKFGHCFLSNPGALFKRSFSTFSVNALASLLSDSELATVAHGMMDDERQAQLEALATLQEQRALTASETATLHQLMEEAQRLMVRKAEAYRLLARRGQPVFSSPGPPLT